MSQLFDMYVFHVYLMFVSMSVHCPYVNININMNTNVNMDDNKDVNMDVDVDVVWYADEGGRGYCMYMDGHCQEHGIEHGLEHGLGLGLGHGHGLRP